MNPLLVVAFFIVWLSVVIYLLQKKQRERDIAAKQRADRSPAVRAAYQQRLESTGNAMLITGALAVVSFVGGWIGKSRSDPVFIGGSTGVLVFVSLLLFSIGYRRQCPVCTAPLRRGARFCMRCGAQLQP